MVYYPGVPLPGVPLRVHTGAEPCSRVEGERRRAHFGLRAVGLGGFRIVFLELNQMSEGSSLDGC